MISTRDLSGLPDIDALRRLMKSMALLDAIFQREWEYRRYSFNSRWSKGRPDQMGSMRNGCGDDWFALFNAAGCWIKGFAHEAPMTPYRRKPKAVFPGVLDGVPAEFEACLREPAFDVADTTFCVWRHYQDAAWRRGEVAFPPGDDPDGSAKLLSPLDGRPETYLEFALDHYEEPPGLTLALVRHVYAHRPLTPKRLAPSGVTLEELAEDLAEIGYPEPPA